MIVQRPKWALCLGGADCVWEDVLAWETLYGKQWDGLIIIANDSGAHWPREFHHWVSLHANKLKRWHDLRTRQQLPAFTGMTWGKDDRRSNPWGTDSRPSSGVLTHYKLNPWGGGSSGMFALQVAREIGCTRAVLCGIPMTPTPHFMESDEPFAKYWASASGHWKAWLRYRDLMLGWARSMSGRTQELLGTPTLEWLLDESQYSSTLVGVKK